MVVVGVGVGVVVAVGVGTILTGDKMKLSAAIRIGSMTTKQIRGLSTDGKNGRCALGAAIEATGASVHPAAWYTQSVHLFSIALKPVINPETNIWTTVVSAVWSLNDFNQWPRERIADWVERIENEVEAEEAKTETKELLEVK